jgi:hypothetical protein
VKTDLQQLNVLVELLMNQNISKEKFDQTFLEIDKLSRVLLQEYEKQHDEVCKNKLVELLQSFKIPKIEI